MYENLYKILNCLLIGTTFLDFASPGDFGPLSLIQKEIQTSQAERCGAER